MRGVGTPHTLLLVRTPEGVGRRSAGGYRIAVEGHRWRPADEQERSRLTRIAVDRGAEPQTVRVISAPLILDGPGRPGAGRSSCRCCAVMVVTRFKDAGPAVSRICGRGSPIPIFAQVRGILTIVMHRCAAAIGSAHGRALSAVESHPPDPNRPHGGHSSLTARARCAQRGPTPARHRSPPHSNRPHFPADSRAAASQTAAAPQPAAPPTPPPGLAPSRPGTFHAAGRVSLRPGGHSTPSGTAIPSPNAQDVPGGKKKSPHAQDVPTCQRALGDTAYVGRVQCRAPSAESGAPGPRTAADSTTTADTAFVRAAPPAIATIGDH